jgi:hypothetical protein
MESIFRDINNPKINKIKIIPKYSIYDKKEPQKEPSKESLQKETPKESPSKEPQLDNKEYVARICRENKTKFMPIYDRDSQLIISPDFSKVAFKCLYNHPHLLYVKDIDDGTAKCPTCSTGSVFSKKIVAIFRDEFDITIILKNPDQNMKEDIIYHNPVNKLEIICEIAGNDRYIAENETLRIYVHQKPKNRIITFIKNILLTFKKINPPLFYPLPFAEDSLLNYYENKLVENPLLLSEEKLILFENC